jgi:hypothetical protein
MLMISALGGVLLVILLTAAPNSGDLHRLYALGVPPRPEEVVEEVEDAEPGEEPVEEVEPVPVEVVVGKPAAVAAGAGGAGDPVDERHEHGAEVEAEGVGAVGHGGEEGLHAGERLLVEELDEPHGGEHLGEPEHEELRRDPENGQEPAAVGRGVAAPGLDERGCDHGEGDGEETHADALERRDPRGDAREAAHGGHEGGLVGRDQRDEHEVGDRLQRGRRDVEGGGEAGVHGAALLHGEGLQLRQDGVEDDGAREDGDHAQQHLHLLHLRRRAQAPRALLPRRRRPAAGAVLRLHACLVQEPDLQTKNNLRQLSKLNLSLEKV